MWRAPAALQDAGAPGGGSVSGDPGLPLGLVATPVASDHADDVAAGPGSEAFPASALAGVVLALPPGVRAPRHDVDHAIRASGDQLAGVAFTIDAVVRALGHRRTSLRYGSAEARERKRRRV